MAYARRAMLPRWLAETSPVGGSSGLIEEESGWSAGLIVAGWFFGLVGVGGGVGRGFCIVFVVWRELADAGVFLGLQTGGVLVHGLEDA